MTLDSNDIIGLIGAGILLFAFFRSTVGIWTNSSLWYELDNFLAAGLLSYYNYTKSAYITMIVNVIWLIVAVVGLRGIRQRRLIVNKKSRRKV